jgi:hypothetical protein
MKVTICITALLFLILSFESIAGGHKGRPFNEADFKAELSGDQQVPPVDVGTYGEAKFIDNGDGTVDFELELEDAENATGGPGAHIHCAAAGSNGPVVIFLAGGSIPGFDGHLEIKGSFSEASILNDSCGATIAEVLQSMADGLMYVNVHSADFPPGAVRGQIYLD